MAEFGVGFNVTANVSQFTSGMREAGEAAKGFKKGFNDTFGDGAFGGLAKFLSVGGVAMSLISWFRSATDAAQQMREDYAKIGRPLDDSVASVARFGDAIDSLKNGIKDASVSALSFFTRAGEGFGNIINWFRGMSDGGNSLGKQYAETLKNAEEQERKLAEARKEYGPEAQAKAEKELQDARRKTYLESATNEEKYTALMAERFALAQKIEGMTEGSVARKKAETQYEQLTQEINKTTAAILSDQEKSRAEIAKAAQEEIDATMEVVDWNIEVEASLRKQAEEQERSAEAARRTADEKEREAAATIRAVSAMAPLRGGDQFNDASDATLKGIVASNRAKAASIRSDVSRLTPFGNLGSMEASRLEFEAQNAQSVLDARNSLRRNVGIGGVDYARSQYAGDPLMFDQMMQRWVADDRSKLEIQKDANQLLKDLNDRLLKAGFGK